MTKKYLIGLITGLFLVCGMGLAQATIVGFIELGGPQIEPVEFGGPQIEPVEFGGPQLEPVEFAGPQLEPVEFGGPQLELSGPSGLGGSFGLVELGGPQLESDGPGGVLFGQSAPGESQSVPEPATMLLIGVGLVGLAGLKIREKK